MNITKFMTIFEGSTLDGDKIILDSGVHEALKFASQDSSFNVLKDITAVDKLEKGIELTYHLYSNEDEEDLLITTYVKDEAESIIDLFKSAIADENEIFDMFGVKFIGNENLKRLYMPQDWEGAPLKKDYVEKDSRLAWNDENNV